MHEFKYRGSFLYCEDIKIQDLTREIPTPFYLYSYTTLLNHYHKLKSAFKSIDCLICFSMKANSNLSICKALVREGAGLDIVSGGELYKALKINCPPKRIVFASVGKTEEEIRSAIKANILFLNVESLSELKTIEEIAQKLKKRVDVCIRLNPGISPHTHKFITTGELINKFGIDMDTTAEIFLRQDSFPHLKIKGIHTHIGSQITSFKPFMKTLKKIFILKQRLKKKNIDFEWLNIGGGLGIIYKKERVQTAFSFAHRLVPYLKKLNIKLIIEPGRFIVGNAGILVTKILYIKKTPYKKFIVVDCGMNDLLRPALYGAYHKILSLKKSYASRQRYDIVGPVCESADFLAKERMLPSSLKEGDFLAVMGAGAYGFSMSSNYNSRLRPAEVMVKGNHYYLIRKRETYPDLVKKEIIPHFLKDDGNDRFC